MVVKRCGPAAAVGLLVSVLFAGCSASPKASPPIRSHPTLPPAIRLPTATAVHLLTVPLSNVPIPAGVTVVENRGRGTEVLPFHVKSLHLFAEENCVGPGRLSIAPFMAIGPCNNAPVYGTITIYPNQRNLNLKIEASPKTQWSVYIVDERTGM